MSFHLGLPISESVVNVGRHDSQWAVRSTDYYMSIEILITISLDYLENMGIRLSFTILIIILERAEW